MRVRKYQAKTMAEAMKMVKAELGPNAVILNTRDIGKGLLGVFMGRGVEVVAGIDLKDNRNSESQNRSSVQTPSPLSSPAVDKAPRQNPNRPPVGRSVDYKVDDSPELHLDNPLLALSKQLAKESQNIKKELSPNGLTHYPSLSKDQNKSLSPDNGNTKATPPESKRLENRLNHMEDQLDKLTGLIEKLVPKQIGPAQEPPIPKRTRELYNHLLEHDVDESLALSITNHIAETTDEDDDVWTALKAYLTNQIKVGEPLTLDFSVKKPKIILLIGPTGVGKTTTLAKISAQYRYSTNNAKRPKIVFITADLFRLAAVEQLQKYTEILGCELEVTYSPEEAKQAINKHKDAQLILFDTAGTCQRNVPQLSTLKAICEASEPTETHLVLSSTTKYSDLIDVIEHFKDIRPDRFIFTKIDESTTYGPMLNIMVKYQIPISYVTTGQNVPEDIERARPERLAKLLMTKPTVNRSLESIVFNEAVAKEKDQDGAQQHQPHRDGEPMQSELQPEATRQEKSHEE